MRWCCRSSPFPGLTRGICRCAPFALQLTRSSASSLRISSPGIEKKQLTLYLEVPEFLYVTADEKGMALVLRNLISNAVKYAPPGKAVKLRAFSEKRRVVVEVFNEGPPVAERDLPYLWDAFYRAEESRTRENGAAAWALPL